jgi:hypothetical protein
MFAKNQTIALEKEVRSLFTKATPNSDEWGASHFCSPHPKSLSQAGRGTSIQLPFSVHKTAKHPLSSPQNWGGMSRVVSYRERKMIILESGEHNQEAAKEMMNLIEHLHLWVRHSSSESSTSASNHSSTGFPRRNSCHS